MKISSQSDSHKPNYPTYLVSAAVAAAALAQTACDNKEPQHPADEAPMKPAPAMGIEQEIQAVIERIRELQSELREVRMRYDTRLSGVICRPVPEVEKSRELLSLMLLLEELKEKQKVR